MTRPEQPKPYPGDDGAPLTFAGGGKVRVRRQYRDPLDRPLSGDVVLTGTVRTDSAGTVTVPIPFPVKLDADGVLDVLLPPDRYQVVEALRSPEGGRYAGTSVLVVEPETP